MTQQVINIGTLPDDGTGDTLRTTGIKVNANFNEVYGVGTALAPLPGINWFDVKSYGAKVDGVTDDTAAIQFALNTCATAGGGTVYVPDGTALISGQGTYAGLKYCLRLTPGQNNVSLVLSPKATIKYTGAADYQMLVVVGAAIGSTTLTTANVPIATTTVAVTSTASLTIGDDCVLADNLNFEVNKIANIVGLTVTLDQPTQFAYATAQGANLQSQNFVDNTTISGGTWEGNNLSNTIIELFGTKRSIIRDLIVQNTQPSVANGAQGRGILLGNTDYACVVQNCRVYNVAEIGIESYVLTSYDVIRDCIVIKAHQHGLAMHGRFNQMDNNRVVNAGNTSAHAGIQIDSGQYLLVDGCMVTACSGGAGIQAAGGTVAHLIVSGCQVIGNSGGNAGIFANTVTDLTLVGNRVTKHQGDGIYLTSVSRAVLKGNASSANVGSGFRFNTGNNLTVEGNDFTNNTAGWGMIFATNPTNARIVGNDVSGNSSGPISGTPVGFRVGNINTTGASQGQAILVAGTIIVSTLEIRTGDSIHLTRVVAGGTLGHLSIGTIVDLTSFVISSSSGTDTSTIFWQIMH